MQGARLIAPTVNDHITPSVDQITTIAESEITDTAVVEEKLVKFQEQWPQDVGQIVPSTKEEITPIAGIIRSETMGPAIVEKPGKFQAEHYLQSARRSIPQPGKGDISPIVNQITSTIRSELIESALTEEKLGKSQAERYSQDARRIVPSARNEEINAIVDLLTAIIRSEITDTAIMEEKLGNSGLELTVEVAEMVLKRCFKDCNAAIKFFSWCRRQPGFRHSTISYNTMLYIAGESRNFDLVDLLLRWMEEDSCDLDLKSWTILVQHFGKGRKISRALLAFDRMKKLGFVPDHVAYSALIRALCVTGKVEMAVEFYKEMISGGYVPGRDVYELVMSAAAQIGDSQMVRFLEEDMGKHFEEDLAFNTRLKSLCISGKIEEVIEEIKGKELDSLKTGIVVTGLAKAGRVSEAMELVVEAEKRGFLCDSKILGQIVSVFLRRRDLISAREVMSRMEEQGYSPDLKTCTEMIQHLSRAGEIDLACEIFSKMVERGEEMDGVVIVAMAAGYVQNGRVAEAWELVERMKKKGIKFTRKSCFVLNKELGKISKDAYLREKAPGSSPEEETSASMFYKKNVECMKTIPGSSEWISLGKEVFPVVAASLREKEMKASTISSDEEKAALRICKKEEVDIVERILGSSRGWSAMVKKLKNSKISFSPELVEIILSQSQRHGGTALRFFSWVSRTAGVTHTVNSYHLAMKISGAGKDFAFMRHLHEEMKRKGLPRNANTWTIMIAQYGRAGLTEIAMRKFAEMKEEGFSPNASTFKFMIISLCGRKGRNLEAAQKMLDEMFTRGFSPDQELATIFVTCLCENGKVNEARSCVDLLIRHGSLTSQLGFSLLVKGLSRSGQVEEALKLVGPGGSHSVDEFVYGSLVNGLLRAGREAEALAKIEEMKEAGFRSTVHVYTSLMAYFFREKRPDCALAMLEKMKEEGCTLTLVTCSVLILGYVRAGMVNEAWNVFRKMTADGPKPDFRTYSAFMAALTRVGKSQEAVLLIDDMVKSGISPSAVNFQTVLFGLNREGKYKLARAVLRKKWDLKRKRKFLG